MYFGDPTYFEELYTISNAVVEKIVVAIDESGDPVSVLFIQILPGHFKAPQQFSAAMSEINFTL